MNKNRNKKSMRKRWEKMSSLSQLKFEKNDDKTEFY